jgi:hypothetical protein
MRNNGRTDRRTNINSAHTPGKPSIFSRKLTQSEKMESNFNNNHRCYCSSMHHRNCFMIYGHSPNLFGILVCLPIRLLHLLEVVNVLQRRRAIPSNTDVSQTQYELKLFWSLNCTRKRQNVITSVHTHCPSRNYAFHLLKNSKSLTSIHTMYLCVSCDYHNR